MNSRTGFFLVCLLAIAVCNNVSQNRLVTKLVELNNLVGAAPADVARLAEKVHHEIDAAFHAFEHHHKVFRRNCASGRASLLKFQKRLTDDVQDMGRIISKSHHNIAEAKKEEASARKGLASTKKELGENVERVGKLARAVTKLIVESNQKLVALRQLRNIAVDELLNGSKPGQFVQVEAFVQKVNELKGMINTNEDALYAPLLTSLISLSSAKNYVHQNTLNRILRAISNFSRNIKKAVHDAKDHLRSERKQSHKLIQILGKQIVEYRNQIAESTATQAGLAGRIRRSKLQRQHFHNELKRKAAELGLWREACKREAHLNATVEHVEKAFAKEQADLFHELA